MPQVPIWGTLKMAITESVSKSETLNLFRCSRQGLRVVGLSLRRLHENMEFLLIWLWVVTDQSGDWSHSALKKQDCTKIVHILECALWMMQRQILSRIKTITPALTLIFILRVKSQWWWREISYQVPHFKCITIDFFLFLFFSAILIAFLKKYDLRCLMKFNLYINSHPSQSERKT